MLRTLIVLAVGWLLTAPCIAGDGPLKIVQVWGKLGKEPGEFHSPIGIAINDKDELYVSEFRNNRVQKFTSGGKFLLQIPVEKMAGGIAVDKQRRIYIAPLMSHKICVYAESGKLLHEWGKEGKGDGEFDQPGGIAIAGDGTVYVADQVNRRVQRFTPEGKFLAQWGEYGTKPGQFDGVDGLKNRTGGPHFLAFDKKGDVFTTEGKLGRIQKFTPDGRPLLAFGSNSTDPGGFGGRPKNLPGPIGIAIDRWDRIWVSSTNNRVQCFSPTGKYLFGAEALTPGDQPGQFHTPHALAFDSKDFLYVVDAQNQRVQKFAVPPASGPGTQDDKASNTPRIVAHRGLFKHAPENTLAAFGACLAVRCGFELDVRRTRDGQLICMHDEDVRRTTNGSGKVSDLSLAELRKLDAGGWFDPAFAGERPPTLAEVLPLLKDAKYASVLVALDIKVEDDGMAGDIARLADQHGLGGQLVCIGNTITSANLRRQLRAAAPKLGIAVLAQKAEELESALAEKNANWIYVRFLPTPEQAGRIHKAGKRVFLSGPLVAGNEPETWRQAQAADVDAVLTDYPLECRAAWRQRK